MVRFHFDEVISDDSGAGASVSVTLKDVAELAGVSTATVSYVVNNGPRPVKSKTRERVLAAMQQLDYQPRRSKRDNAPADYLTIGVIVPNASSEFFGSALEGIETILYAQGHHCLVSSSHSDLAIEKRLIQKLFKLVDGLIITPAAELGEEIETLPDLGLPTIIMDRQVSASNLSGVAIDNVGFITQTIRLLGETGHRRIALINGPAALDPVQQRLSGYQTTLKETGLGYDPELIFNVPFTSEAGREAILDLMSIHHPPDAVICTSTDLAVGALQGLNELGCQLPDDIALVCYGDPDWASLVSPAITVVDAPTRLMGATSARLLLQAIQNDALPEPKHVFLETRLILRDSHQRRRR